MRHGYIIKDTPTLAQVELAIDVARMNGNPEALIRFNANYIDELERDGIKTRKFHIEGEKDVYLARYMNEKEKQYVAEMWRKRINEQQRKFEKEG